MRGFWLAAFALLLAGCGEAVVDGACADGYTFCGGACRPAVVCAPGDASAETVADSFAPDVLDPDGESDGSGSEGGVPDGLESDGLLTDGLGTDGPMEDALADAPAVDGCVPPYTNDGNCGACGLACSGATPTCKEQLDGSWACKPTCEPPTVACPSGCADLDVDPNNCGGCGKFCPTGLCNGGKCRGARAGHIVLIGHDYSGAAPGFSVSKVLENAVFLASKNPVRVLSFEPFADPASVAGVKANLDAAAAASGRTWNRSVASSIADFRDRLLIDSFDVALIFDQPSAPKGSMDLVGADLKLSLDSFSRVGGVVVMLDGGTGEMPLLLTASGMLLTASHAPATGLPVEVTVPGDAVGVGVFSPYSAAARSVTFTLSEPTSSSLVPVVVEPASGKPVVLHKVVFK